MPNYRRMYVPGGTYFFTVVTYQRQPLFADRRVRDALHRTVEIVGKRHPFDTLAWVLMPDHLHCIWTLPKRDADYSTRWRLIKRGVTQKVRVIHPSPLWQPRFWEHTVRDETDLFQHIHYIHFNPVKHGYVEEAEAWHFSSYQRFLEESTVYTNRPLPRDIDLEGVE
ncbi:MAG: transposase [candidate division Zixibacteria bacterium]|nr:transposase [candidate division Zixibacteria bacterium]